MINKQILEISKLLKENEEIKKCENEFRHHMNNTIDRLQKNTKIKEWIQVQSDGMTQLNWQATEK